MEKMKRQRSGKDNRKGKHVFGVEVGGDQCYITQIKLQQQWKGGGGWGALFGLYYWDKKIIWIWNVNDCRGQTY